MLYLPTWRNMPLYCPGRLGENLEFSVSSKFRAVSNSPGRGSPQSPASSPLCLSSHLWLSARNLLHSRGHASLHRQAPSTLPANSYPMATPQVQGYINRQRGSALGGQIWRSLQGPGDRLRDIVAEDTESGIPRAWCRRIACSFGVDVCPWPHGLLSQCAGTWAEEGQNRTLQSVGQG